MRAMMAERDAMQMKRDNDYLERDMVVAQRQEIEQRFVEFIALCIGPTIAFSCDLFKVGDQERYYRDLYEKEVPPKRWAPSYSQAHSSSRNRSHSRSQSTKGVVGPHKIGPYGRPPSTQCSLEPPHESSPHSPHGSSGISSQGNVILICRHCILIIEPMSSILRDTI